MNGRALMVALALLLGSAGESVAASGERTWRPIRVGVLPGESFVRSGEAVFEERAVTREAREELGAWQRRVEDALRGLDLVRIIETSRLREQLEAPVTVPQTLALARERFELGRERYRILELEAASSQLDRALELMHSGWSDLNDPRAIADVHLYRGLAMMDRDLESEALVAFRSMWLHDPSRRFQHGYYPSATEAVMARALDDLVATDDLIGARFSAGRLAEVVAASAVDALMVVALVHGERGPVLRVTIFDAASRLRTVDLRADLSSPERAAQEVERALSRWHSCAIQSEERSYVAKPRPVRWSIDLSYAHALFLQHDRTRELFPSPGGTVGLTYRAGRALQLFAQMNQMVSVPDDNRDLLEPMMTTRLSFGAGLVATVGRFEPFARVGAEVGVTQSDVEMTRDVACKHFGDPPEGIAVESHPCDPARIFTVEAPAVAVGLHVGLGLRWLFASRWHAQIESQMAAYVAGDDFPISDLNFPLTLTTGVGHRF